MTKIEIRKAERKKSKLRIGLAGPSGSGKTMSALKLARGIAPEGKIVLIDTERSSGDLYSHLFDYNIIDLQPPYAPKNYVEAIKAAENAGYDVIIIDSLSHAWSDEGGLLDQADKKSAVGGNRFTMWAELTPQHRALVNGMLNSTADIIATVRSKQEYAMERDEKTGKSSVKKLGMAPVQREGMEYEFTVFIDIEINHAAHVSKDRTDLFKDEVFVIDEKIGKRIADWRSSGKDIPPPPKEKVEIIKKMKLLFPELKNGGMINKIVEVTKLDPAKEENLQEINARLTILVGERDQYQNGQ